MTARNSNTAVAETETALEEVAFTAPTLSELASERGNTRAPEQFEQDVVNPMVLADLVGCRPQMIYNYIRKGKLTTVKQNNTQKLVIPLDVAQEWANDYLTRKGEKQIRIERELAGQGAE